MAATTYFWTKKAEMDWCERHPEVKNPKKFKRRAGEIATYDGEPLKSGEIQRTFKSKGWVVDNVKKIYRFVDTKADFNESKLAAEQKSREQKWKILYDLIMGEKLTVGQASARIGSSFVATRSFIRAWQDQLGPKIGYIDYGQDKVSLQAGKSAA